MARLTRPSLLLLALASLISLSPAAPAADPPAAPGSWTQWRGPNRDGISSEKGFLTSFPSSGPTIAWKANVGEGYAILSVADGKVLTLGDVKGKDTVWCFDADTGNVLWKYAINNSDDPHACPTPAIDNGKVYALASGNLLCLNLADGKLVWSKNVQKDFSAPKPQYGFANSPLLLGNAVILDVGTNVALDKTTGALLWKSPDGEPSYGSPVPFQRRRYIPSSPPSSPPASSSSTPKAAPRSPPTTGAPPTTSTPPPPIISGDKIFISSGYGHGFALVKLAGSSLSKVYENKSMENQYTTSVLYQGHIYGLSDGHNLRCLDLETGKVLWSQSHLGAGGLVIADGKLIIMADGGTLAIVEANPNAYKPLASAKVLDGKCWTAPTLADGRVYCRSYAGNIVCVTSARNKHTDRSLFTCLAPHPPRPAPEPRSGGFAPANNSAYGV